MVKNVFDKLPVPEGCGHWAGHITTGIIGGKYLFQALADAGHKDVALHILETTDYPGESAHHCMTLYSPDCIFFGLYATQDLVLCSQTKWSRQLVRVECRQIALLCFCRALCI